jgi:hypothetical protein
MAKTKPRKKLSNTNNNTGIGVGQLIDTAVDGFWRFLISIITTIGFPGAAMFFIMYLMVNFSDDKQKKEFFDMWLLFKGAEVNCSRIIVYIVLFAILVFIAQWVYYAKRRKLDIAEIDRISKSKTDQQGGSLGGHLHHS